MYTVTLLGVGIAMGMYIASQIGEHIDRRTRRDKFLRDMESFNKKHKNNETRKKKGPIKI